MELDEFASDFAKGMCRADARKPVSKKWRPGIGPHDELDVIRLVMEELESFAPDKYEEHEREVSYPGSKARCDLCLGPAPHEWAIEIKALRMLGDKGIVVQGRDEVSKILSPYSKQRSALTDCAKLAGSGLGARQAIVIYAYDHDDYPMMTLVDAFELLARRTVRMGPREEAPFDGLIHPVHQRGSVFAWELLALLEE